MQRLINIQNKLKAPKGQYNSFGKYKYRSAEDILEAVKPLLQQEKCALLLSDDVIMLGSPEKDHQCRFYVVATAQLIGDDGREIAKTSAMARESSEKKGQDDSQITGTASSYARKYALNGLFCIDDNKDADTDEYHEQTKADAQSKKISIMKEKIKGLLATIDSSADTSMFDNYESINDVETLTNIGIAVKKLSETKGAK